MQESSQNRDHNILKQLTLNPSLDPITKVEHINVGRSECSEFRVCGKWALDFLSPSAHGPLCC